MGVCQCLDENNSQPELININMKSEDKRKDEGVNVARHGNRLVLENTECDDLVQDKIKIEEEEDIVITNQNFVDVELATKPKGSSYSVKSGYNRDDSKIKTFKKPNKNKSHEPENINNINDINEDNEKVEVLQTGSNEFLDTNAKDINTKQDLQINEQTNENNKFDEVEENKEVKQEEINCVDNNPTNQIEKDSLEQNNALIVNSQPQDIETPQQEEKVNSQEQEKEIGIIITDSNFFI